MSGEERIQKNSERRIQHSTIVSVYLAVYDAIAVSFAYFFALLLRFDFSFSHIPVIYLKPWMIFAPFYAAFCIVVFRQFRLYSSIWRFASFRELQRITIATIVTTIIHIIGVTIVLHIIVKGTEYTLTRMPISYYIMGAILQAILVTAIRFSYRFVLLLRAAKSGKAGSNIMIIGLNSIIRTT